MGESVRTTILNWLKEVGDKMKRMRQYFSSKVDSEVPSEVSGILWSNYLRKTFEPSGANYCYY
jgi:pyruvate/2-oxoglutarate dehydrogenase complex dihydrolipoamide acyltransferase (E2) component